MGKPTQLTLLMSADTLADSHSVSRLSKKQDDEVLEAKVVLPSFPSTTMEGNR